MKKLILSIVIAAIGFAAAHAQDSTKVRKAPRAKFTAEQRAEMASKNMQQKLGLSDDQKQKVYALELDRIKKTDEWRKQDHEAMKGKMNDRKSFIKGSKDKLDQILTPEQKSKLESLRKDQKEKFKDQKPGMKREMRMHKPKKPDAPTPPPAPPVKE